MLVLSAGMKKSGSTWFFHLSNSLLMSQGHPDAFRALRHMPRAGILGKPYSLQIWWAAVPHVLGNTTVIKTHAPPTRSIQRLTEGGIVKPTYIFRDPRDASVSLYEFGRRLRAEGRRIGPHAIQIHTLEEAIHFIGKQLRIWEAWEEYGKVLLVRYEDLQVEPVEQLRRLADYLNMSIRDETLEHIVGEHQNGHIAEEQRQRLKFNRGTSGRHRTVMTVDQLALSEEVFGPYLARMGYTLRIPKNHDNPPRYGKRF